MVSRGSLLAVTKLSTVGVGGVGLTYLGYSIEDLCKHACFEEVAFLLLHGYLPNRSQLLEFQDRLSSLAQPVSRTADGVGAIATGCASDGCPSDGMFRTGNARTRKGFGGPTPFRRAPLGRVRRACCCIGIVFMIHGAARHFRWPPFDCPVFSARTTWQIGSGVACACHGRIPHLYSEHEFNASTFTARIVASTLSDFYSCTTAAIGALRGPLHGGANEASHGTDRTLCLFLRKHNPVCSPCSKEKRRSWGLGIACTKTSIRDPNHTALVSNLCESTGHSLLYAVSERIEQVMRREKRMFPNLDFYSAIGLPLLGHSDDDVHSALVLSRISGGLRISLSNEATID